MKFSAYTYNRSGNPSPYEKLYGRKPRIDHLHEFGAICYAWKPEEKRDFKFEPVREKCRFIGYADDDEVEIMNGYVLLREHDRFIFYSKDVVFPKKAEEIRKLSDTAEDLSMEDYYVIDNHLEDTSYQDEVITDDSTQNNTESSQSNQDAVQEIMDGPALNTRSHRREAMTTAEIRQLQSPTAESESEDDYQTAANITIDTDASYNNSATDSDDGEVDPFAYFTRQVDCSNDVPILEYEEIWESLFTRYDVIHECYRTHKQDPSIPKNYKQLMQMKANNHPEYKFYETAMQKEEDNMEDQQVYKKNEILNTLPLDKDGKTPHFVDSVWAFAKMFDEKGKLLKYKARLCGRGFREIQGIDYDEVYSPTVKQKIVRATVAIAASKNWKIYQDDCKAAYLNAALASGKWLKLPNGKYVFIYENVYTG